MLAFNAPADRLHRVCLWPVSHVHPAVMAIAIRVNGVSSRSRENVRYEFSRSRMYTVALKYFRMKICVLNFSLFDTILIL